MHTNEKLINESENLRGGPTETESTTRRSQVLALIKLLEIKEDQRRIDQEVGKMPKQPEEDEHTVVSNHTSPAQTKT